MCVCVCVCEREREREKDREAGKTGDRGTAGYGPFALHAPIQWRLVRGSTI